MSTRVLVVDDTVVFRRVISEALSGIPGIEVVGTASNGKLALSRLESLKPDLITLDIEMPEMDGIDVLRAMKRAGTKAGTIVLSAVTLRGAEMAMRALELGAFDFLPKPDTGTPDENLSRLRAQLMPIVRAYERRHGFSSTPPGPTATPLPEAVPAASTRSARAFKRNSKPLILIGVSTGGPPALSQLIPALPKNLGAPVFIVQHMPALFTGPLAASLGGRSSLPVKEGEDGEAAKAGCVYIAPGGRQMKLEPGASGEILIRVNDDPPENNCRPSVDYLFRSAALNFPGRAVAAILTGMGNDGTAGLKLLKRGGCYAIAQDEASCVVFGMPREAINAGLVDSVQPLGRIAETIVRLIQEPLS
jgi:two-component system, chemotaxis family, protein-glutamate methylesterase/glutaminase